MVLDYPHNGHIIGDHFADTISLENVWIDTQPIIHKGYYMLFI